jgi:hypothetical protein
MEVDWVTVKKMSYPARIFIERLSIPETWMNARLTDSRGFGSTKPFSRAQHFRIGGSRRPPKEKSGGKFGEPLRSASIVTCSKPFSERSLKQRNGHPAARRTCGSSVDRLRLHS